MSDPVSVTTADSDKFAWSTFELFKAPELDEWTCYMFGSTPSGPSFIYQPLRGQVPNWFIRWMMRICLGCTWVKNVK